MKVYSYNPFSGEYIGSNNANKDPLESEKQGKDIWLLPANATFDKPPNVKDDEVAAWINNAWQAFPKKIKPEPEEPPVDPNLQNEIKIANTMRYIAIQELIKEGELPQDYK